MKTCPTSYWYYQYQAALELATTKTVADRANDMICKAGTDTTTVSCSHYCMENHHLSFNFIYLNYWTESSLLILLVFWFFFIWIILCCIWNLLLQGTIQNLIDADSCAAYYVKSTAGKNQHFHPLQYFIVNSEDKEKSVFIFIQAVMHRFGYKQLLVFLYNSDEYMLDIENVIEIYTGHS